VTGVLLWCKWAGVVSLMLSFCVAWLLCVGSPAGWPRRAWSAYAGSLERALRPLALPVTGSAVAAIQLVAGVLVVGAGLLGLPGGWLWVFPTVLAPRWMLSRLNRRRTLTLERQLEGFVATLANCLKVTPNLGTALAILPGLLPCPVRAEVQLTNHEVGLGAALDDALLAMAARIGSPQFDSVLRALVIGRRLGGNLPATLATTAAALRELARLEGVVQARTSEARAQLAVLAVCPFGIVVLLAVASPGYFRPLQSSPLGWLLAFAAGLLWLGSLLVARRVLAVEP
jgi:tight adherence protein B